MDTFTQWYIHVHVPVHARWTGKERGKGRREREKGGERGEGERERRGRGGERGGGERGVREERGRERGEGLRERERDTVRWTEAMGSHQRSSTSLIVCMSSWFFFLLIG